MVGNHLLQFSSPIIVNLIFDRTGISDDIPPQMKILNTIIPKISCLNCLQGIVQFYFVAGQQTCASISCIFLAV